MRGNLKAKSVRWEDEGERRLVFVGCKRCRFGDVGEKKKNKETILRKIKGW